MIFSRPYRLFDIHLRLGLAHSRQSRDVESRPRRHLLQWHRLYRPQSNGLHRLSDDQMLNTCHWFIFLLLLTHRPIDKKKILFFFILITNFIQYNPLCAVCYYFISSFNFMVKWFIFYCTRVHSNIIKHIHKTHIVYLFLGLSYVWTRTFTIGKKNGKKHTGIRSVLSAWRVVYNLK